MMVKWSEEFYITTKRYEQGANIMKINVYVEIAVILMRHV